MSHEIVFKIADRFKSPDWVKETVLDPNNRNPQPLSNHILWSDQSLAGGYPGVLLFLCCLNSCEPGKWDGIIHSYILKVQQSLEKDGCHGLSLFGGLAGVCFSVLMASKGRTRYQRFLSSVEDYLIKKTHTEYIEPLWSRLEAGLPIHPLQYDVIQGISGIGLYALLCLEQERFVLFSKEIARILTVLAQPIQRANCLVPGWHQPQDMQFIEREKQMFPQGSFNLGLAHGVPSILGFLTTAMRCGIVESNQKSAVETIVDWLNKKIVDTELGMFVPHKISWDEEVQGKTSHVHFSRDAWCYGAGGVARTLYLAGSALNREDLKIKSVQMFKDIFRRKSEHWGVPSSTMCHGMSGLLLIGHLMEQDSKDEDLAKCLDDLEGRLMCTFSEEFPFGFQDLDPMQSGGFAHLNKAGILEGASGVLATLLTRQKPTPAWYYPFLIA